MKKLLHKPLFWLIFSTLSIACIGFSYKYFSTAFPIVTITLDMNRSEALEKAAQLASQLHMGPTDFHQAASFGVDEDVQTFVELEAGGKQAFATMIREPYYAPYQWTVRHFKECEKNESLFKFKPDGTPYGFIETISENALGAALEQNQAQTIAETIVTQSPWNIPLTDYTLIESSKEIRPHGRVDHQFTYERTGITIGKGLYRLRLVVSGDKISEITHSVKVPQEFTLRYQEMRSANNSIATAAGMAYLLLYILGGCIIGLFSLLRRNWILWKHAIIWALIIAGLHVLVSINQLPLAWMQYHTALSMHGFLLKMCMGMIAQFISMATFYGLIFTAAESLTRAAFSDHPQVWKLWNPQAACSTAIAERTIGGYLLVPVCLAFIIFFYICTSMYLDWWMPSASLIDPNILATYFPWLSCLVLSLGAGFMEECLFRAIPISCAALIGKRWGNQRIWLIIGFITQALIFGAAHANYAAQPAYARVVELLFFSTLNGLVFLRFGLLPAIITHFTYDVVLMSLPLFVSTAAGAWMNQAMVILLTLIPLIIIIRARILSGAWTSLNPQFLNRSWKPNIHNESEVSAPHMQETITISSRTQKIIAGAALIGLILLATTARFTQDAPRLDITKTHALEDARTLLKSKNISSAQWDALPTIADATKDTQEQQLQNTFIWQEGGPALYHQLLGSYINPPRWYIRFATWKGSLSDRAQEHVLSLAYPGKLYRYYHKLPENAPGRSLDETQARILAHEGLKTSFNLDATQLQEISAVATKHPERKDWTFTFANPRAYRLSRGQLRNVIEIAGDEIIGSYGYVHVPEEWEREQLNTQNMLTIISFLCSLLLYLILGGGFIFAAMRRKRIQLLTRSTLYFCIGMCALGILKVANSWPLLIANFTTSEPFMHQVFSYLGMGLVGTLFRAGALGVILAILSSWRKQYAVSDKKLWAYGVSMGIFASGALSLLENLHYAYEPLWANYSSLATILPFLDSILQAVVLFIGLSALLITVCIIMDLVHAYWHQRPWILIAFAFFIGIALAGKLCPETIMLWIINGTMLGMLFTILYFTIGRYSNQALIWAAATITSCYYLQQALFNAYPYAISGNLGAILAIIGITALWERNMNDYN